MVCKSATTNARLLRRLIVVWLASFGLVWVPLTRWAGGTSWTFTLVVGFVVCVSGGIAGYRRRRR